MKQSEANVLRAAQLWFEDRKPEYWTTSDHLANPTIKRVGNRADEKLAIAVAKYLELKLTREKKRGS